MRNLIGIMAIAAALSACGPWGKQKGSETKIYGGRLVPDAARMDAVALTDADGVFCSGTAVSPTLVLTAAHCAIDKSADSVRVYVGPGISGGDASMQGQYAVAQMETHPLYHGDDPDQGHDAAFLKLSTPIDLPASAFTTILTDPSEMKELLRGGQDTYLVGFGWNKKNILGLKNEVKAKVRKLFPLEVVLGGSGRDACQGDSGGPAYGQLKSGAWRVYGITSRGSDCGAGGIWGLMSVNICWAQAASAVSDLVLPKGFCSDDSRSRK